jgi:V-type H+-transporting ATPase subunit D
VANKKQRDTAAADAEMKARREAADALEAGDKVDGDAAGPTDILAGEDEEDVIF